MDEVAPIWPQLKEGFAMELTAEQMVVEGDTVAVCHTERGTFRDEFFGNNAALSAMLGEDAEDRCVERLTIIG